MQADTSPTSRPDDAESRFVALLKFDLVDSTRISDSLSPTDELELQRSYRAAVERLLPPPDRVKIEWEGDGGLIVFGYPATNVDAALEAVRTGLDLIAAVQKISAIPGLRLNVRIGIAAGRVTIDKTRHLLSRVQPVSRATRLMDHAQPGQLLVAEDTRRLIKSFFEYQDLGVVELQGAGRRRVWRVVAPTGVVSRFAAQRADTATEIVGRDELLSQLSDAWSATLEGQGSAICLVGDSGMGKSRLARTVLEWAKRDGAVALEIDCTPSTGNSPLLPLGVLFRRTARIGASMSESDKVNAASQLLADLLGAEKAQETLAYLAPLFGIESVPIPIDKTREQLRAATIGAIVDIVRARAQRGPLALLCEDLHWADDTTAQVVQTVGALVDEIALLFIVTRWPKPVAQVDLEGITAQFTTAPINPLADATAARLVRAVAGEGFPADRVDEIVNRCGGVPLLLEEVTRSTLELANAGEAARTSHTSDSTVPPELQLVVESRLAQWPDLRGVIQAASVLGREFPVPALAAMVPEQADALPEALAQFTEHGLFEPHARPAERATFRHALIRDAVYETLVSRKDLHRLHSRAADALAKGYAGTPDASPEVLARHLREAHRLDEAIRIRLTGAESTFERGAYVEAMGHCQAVGLLLDEVGDQLSVRDDTIRWCVLRGMVESGVHGFSTESALLAYRDAERLLNDATGPELRYPVLRGLALAVLVRGELATAYRYSIDGYEQATRSTRIEHRIDAMSVLAYTTLYVDRLAECRTWIERCLELYDAEHGERFRYPVPQDAKTAALALLPTAAWLLGDAAGAEVAIQRGLQHVDSLGREFDKALLHAWAAGTRYTQRRYLEAIQHAGIAYTVSEAHKFQEWKGIGAMMALISQCALAPAPDAVQQAIMTAERFRALGIGLNRAYFLWGIARGHAVAGNRAAALATLDDALAAAKASEETRMHPEIWLLQAELADDAERRRQLRLDAYRLAQRHGAVANALRAAVAMLADGESRPDAEWAGATLALLDGQAPAPAEAWMPERLKRAEALLGEHRAPA